MKSLEELGNTLIVHKKYESGEVMIVKCTCGLSHIFKALPTTEVVICNCGESVIICRT